MMLECIQHKMNESLLFTERVIRTFKTKIWWSCKNLKIQKIFLGRIPFKLVSRIFLIRKLKNTVLWTYYVIEELRGEEIVGMFYEKELSKKNQTMFRMEKEIKRKEDKRFVKRKVYDNSFNG